MPRRTSAAQAEERRAWGMMFIALGIIGIAVSYENWLGNLSFTGLFPGLTFVEVGMLSFVSIVAGAFILAY